MKILVISPHPDDETLGCGGTILKHKAQGDKIFWLIMTNMLEGEGYSAEQVNIRQKEIDAVSKEYGFANVYKLDLPTTKLDIIPNAEMIDSVSNIIKVIKPEKIYLPNKNDVHSDHKITFDIVFSASKTFRYPSIKKIVMYEVISETEIAPALQSNAFVPNSFSDISEYMESKISIMKIYASELGQRPFPRSEENIRALATFRGSTAGVKYAEAFMLLKEIW